MSEPKPTHQTIPMERRKGESDDRATARVCATPEFRAGITQFRVGTGISGAKLDVHDAIAELQELSKATVGGDLSRCETTLAAQANTLDALFHALTQRSLMNMGEYMGAAETYMRLALKAQSQCRATIETLALVKNPPAVAFVRQANIAHGPQQVNNGVEAPSRAEKSESAPSKLLEASNGDRLDTGAAGAPGRTDPKLETVGAINRPEKRRRKGKG